MPTTAILPYTSPDTRDDADRAGTELVQPPEGGTAAWALVQFCGFGYTSSFGVFQDFYTSHYLTNESSSAISWIGSVSVFIVTCLSPIAGMLYDRGYFYHLLIGGSFLQSFTLFMLSVAQLGQYYQTFLTQGVGFGVSQGLLYVPPSRSSLGSMVHPILLNNLFDRGIGFANGVRISASFVSILLLAAYLPIRTRLEPPKRSVNYLSVGRSVIHDIPFCFMAAGRLFFQTGFYFPFFYLQLNSIQHGNSNMFSFYSLVLLNGGNLIGQLCAGFIAPYASVPILMITSTGACDIVILGMIGLNTVPSVVILATGYFSGADVALISPLMALLTSDPAELGARMGIGTMVAGIGSLIGGPISGGLLTSRCKWWQPSLFSGLVALTGCSLMIMMQLALTHRERSRETQE